MDADVYSGGRIMKKKSLFILIIALIVSLFISCTSEVAKPKQYTVTFDSNGGSEVASIAVTEGEKISEPADPTREWYLFGEWQLNGKSYDFTAEVTSNMKLVAVWKEDFVSVTSSDDLERAIEDGSPRIMLSSDIKITKGIYIDGNKDISLNMNGKRISLDADEKAYGILTVKGNGKLKLFGNGNFDYTKTYYDTGSTEAGANVGYIITVMENAELTIEDGSFFGAMGCIRLGKVRNTTGETAKAYIKGGEFKSEVLYANHYWTFNKMDGTTTAFSITGGKFYKFNPSKGGTENPDEDWVEEGYAVEPEDDYYVVKKN